MSTSDFFKRDRNISETPTDLKAFVIENRLRRKLIQELEGPSREDLEVVFRKSTDDLLFSAQNSLNRMDREALRTAESIYDVKGIRALLHHLKYKRKDKEEA